MMEELTKAEYRVAVLAASGMTARAMALELGVSVKTINTHLTKVYSKLNIKGKSLLPKMAAFTIPKIRTNYAHNKFDEKFAKIRIPLTTRQAMERFSCSQSTALLYLKKYKVLKSGR